jgi:hypothetical protein
MIQCLGDYHVQLLAEIYHQVKATREAGSD